MDTIKVLEYYPWIQNVGRYQWIQGRMQDITDGYKIWDITDEYEKNIGRYRWIQERVSWVLLTNTTYRTLPLDAYTI